MLTFFVVILTIALVVDCLLLGLLILVQLPKKEAGIGMAFGGGAADALFGAGSGTALTKLTKYLAGIFFALVVLLSVAEGRMHNEGFSSMSQEAEQIKKDAKDPSKNPVTPPTAPAVTPGSNTAAPSNTLLVLPPTTNLPSAATNPPPSTGK